MLQRPEGATVDEVASAMGWQRHTVRGLFSGTLKKKLGLTLASAQEERGRVYRIAPRNRHEPRDPGCNGLPGGALAPPRAQSRGASAAMAHSLQSRGIAVPQPRTAGASCRIPDAGSRSRRAAPGAAAPAPSNCSAVQQTGAATTPRRPELKPGTRLVRGWQGQTYEVLVLDDGFSWQGTHYRSLSALARKITGTAWSGPLFFGLKPNRTALPVLAKPGQPARRWRAAMPRADAAAGVARSTPANPPRKGSSRNSIRSRPSAKPARPTSAASARGLGIGEKPL